MSITTALKARREALADREAGFTLIELLVVVLIIGILAAIAIPVYLGVQNNAKDAAVKSDLVNEKTSISAMGIDQNGAVPTAISQAGSATVTGVTPNPNLVTYGWSVSSNTSVLKYTFGGTTGANKGLWCITGTSTTGKFFMISSNTQVANATSATSCPTAY